MDSTASSDRKHRFKDKGPALSRVTQDPLAVRSDAERFSLQISTVGKIPKGIPAPTTSHFETAGYFGKLLLTSLIVAGVGILETIGIAKALAAKNGYEINANQVG